MKISIQNRAFALALYCSLSPLTACVKTTEVTADAQATPSPKRRPRAEGPEQPRPVALSDKAQAEKDITAGNYTHALKDLEAEISATELPLKEH